MGDYGMKVSRAGFDVKTCSDKQLLYSSAFPLMVVRNSGMTNIDNSQTINTHSLGYTPLFLVQRRVDDAGEQHVAYIGSHGLSCNNTKLETTGAWGGSKPISWFIFNRDITESYTAPSIDTTDDTQGAYSADYGWKVSKAGSDVKTAGLTNLVSFSGASAAGDPVRHQIIHKSGTVSINDNTTATIAHGLGYKPMFLTFVYSASAPAGYYPDAVHYTVNAGPPVSVTFTFRAYCDTTNLYIFQNEGGTRTVAYLILKDPLI